MKAGAVPGDTPIPGMSHILGVTSLVMEAGGDEDEVIAALLHDVPEDHGGQVRLDEIRVQFGDRFAGMVAFQHVHRTPRSISALRRSLESATSRWGQCKSSLRTRLIRGNSHTRHDRACSPVGQAASNAGARRASMVGTRNAATVRTTSGTAALPNCR